MSMNIPSGVEYLIGIDEVGRGPLAGPVTLGFIIIKPEDIKYLPEGVTDSKKLSEKKRELLSEEFIRLKKEGKINIYTKSVPATTIDKIGIAPSIKKCIKAGLDSAKVDPKNTMVYLDGGLYGSDEWINQETIIKGDASNVLIGVASIFAKVYRDRYMVKLGEECGDYGFEKHKGYGTKAHREAIIEKGPCEYHRLSYCKNILGK